MNYWWESKSVQLQRKTVWRFLKTLKIELPWKWKTESVSHSVESNSLWSHGLWPIRLLGILQAQLDWVPFPSPGNLPNPGSKPTSPTLQADSLQSEPPVQFSSVAQSCLTLGYCNPMDCIAHQAFLSITNSQSSLKLMSMNQGKLEVTKQEMVKGVAEPWKHARILGLQRRIQSGTRDKAWSLRAFV